MRGVVLAAGACALVLTGCGETNKPAGVALAGDASDCASDQTRAQLKKLLFENAAERAQPNDRLILPNLASQSSLTIEMPVLDSLDKETHKISCSGRISLQFPATAASLFGGGEPTKLDVSYSLQPTADKSGNVYTLLGADMLIAALASTDLQPWLAKPVETSAAAGVAATAVQGAPVSATPAFDPMAELQRDPAFSRRNDQLAVLLSNARDRDTTGQVDREQQSAVRALRACGGRACVQSWLADREAALRQWEQ